MLFCGLQGHCNLNAYEIGEMEMLNWDEGEPKIFWVQAMGTLQIF